MWAIVTFMRTCGPLLFGSRRQSRLITNNIWPLDPRLSERFVVESGGLLSSVTGHYYTSRCATMRVLIDFRLAMPYMRSIVVEQDFNVNLPAIKDDDELSGSEIRSVNHPRPIHHHIVMIKLAMVYRRYRTALKLGRWTNSTIVNLVAQTDESLAQISADLPYYLQSDSSSIASNKGSEAAFPWMSWQRSALKLLMHAIRIDVNKILQNIWSEQGLIFQRVRALCLESTTTIISIALDGGQPTERLNSSYAPISCCAIAGTRF